MRPVHVLAPPGSIVAARLPAAVGAGNVEVSQRVADVCLGALAAALPDRVGAASQGTMNNVLVGGDGWVYYETIGGGQGGRAPAAGAGHESGVHTNMTNTRDTPVEALERALPDARPPLHAPSGERWRRRGPPVATASSASSRCSRPRRCRSSPSAGSARPWGLAGGDARRAGRELAAPRRRRGRGASRSPDKVTVELRSRRRRCASAPPAAAAGALSPTGRIADDLDLTISAARGPSYVTVSPGALPTSAWPERRRGREHLVVVVALLDRADEVLVGSSSPSIRISTIVPGATTSPRRRPRRSPRRAASARAGGPGPRSGPARSSPRRSRRSPGCRRARGRVRSAPRSRGGARPERRASSLGAAGARSGKGGMAPCAREGSCPGRSALREEQLELHVARCRATVTNPPMLGGSIP